MSAMSEPRMVQPDEARALLNGSTPGPWRKGNQWKWAGVLPGFGEGRCAYCKDGEPVWVGRADINGTRMLAHRHADPNPYEPDHYIYGPDDEPVTGNWDYESGGVIDPRDSDMIAAAPDLAHTAAVLGEQRDAVMALLPAWDERIADYLIAGADGVADGLNEALFDLRAALGVTE